MRETGERRKHRRLPLRFPLFLSGEDETGQFIEHAVTENVSAGGVYFRTGVWRQMPAGTRVDVYIEIPSDAAVFSTRSRLKSVGRVVRVEGPQDASAEPMRGVAVQFEKELRFAN